MTKKYLDKHKKQLAGTRGLTKKTLAELFTDVESPELVKEYSKDKSQYLPDVDYSDPANFAKFGLASKYYTNAIKRIYNQYPYDGSKAEQLKFYNELTPLEQYVFDNNYPKKTGYVTFGAAATTWDGTSTLVSGFGQTDTPEYILAYGGPHKDNIYDTEVNQTSNLEVNWSNGATVEFWLKKDVFLNASTETQNECVFYIKNVDDERRLFIYTDSTSPGNLKVSYYAVAYPATGWPTGYTTQIAASLDTGLTTIADSLWHHYAIVFSISDDNYYQVELYVDGVYKSVSATGDLGADLALAHHLTGSSIATIAAIGGGLTSATSYLGYGKLSGSLDDFRFWKTARSAQEIGRNYFTNVAGGTNTDKAKYYYSSSIDSNLVDLGLYYKFNEGILGSTTAALDDDLVLDYSGRVSNGQWVGYSSGARHTGSAMVDSGATDEEKGSPVVYSSHSDVQALITDLETSGSQHDAANNASLYNSMPQWIRDEDGETGETLANLLQMVASYLDTLYGQISHINRLKEPYYASGSIKPIPHNKKLLTSTGFDPPEIFLQSKVIEQILARGEKKLYEEKLHNVKNLIYKNIYNNLSYINKSKGTEKAFRNLFRCFGVDDDLFRLNLYGDNVEYELKNTHESVATKKKVIDFTGFNSRSGDRSAVIYQYPSSSSDYGFISASSDLYVPFSAEAEVIFPKLPTSNHTGSSDLSLLTTVSLFGCHSSTASMDDTDSLFGSPDRDFQVQAVKVDNGERVYFRLTSSTGFLPEISTSTYPQDGESSAKVYDNSKWNFAVRVRPTNYPISSNVITSSGFYLDFYGINNYLGEVLDEFSLSSSISTDTAGDFITGSNKRFFVGAHRDGFTGSVSVKSDVRFSSLRVWHDYISDEEMQYHAKDPNNFGRLNPAQSVLSSSAGTATGHIPKAEALALNWDFETTLTADSSGEFLIRDVSSGSATLRDSYGNFGAHAKANHTAKGYGFTASKLPTTFEFIPTNRQLQPENLYSSDLVNILSTDDLFFTRESRPVKHFFSIEASMYEIISRRMLNFFASIDDFNNQIGEPVNRYRGKYKGLEKLRHLFFDKIEEVTNIEKFVELYKWLDNALDTAVANLIPASANASEEVRTIVENHVLSRNKYRYPAPLFLTMPSPGDAGHTGPTEPPWIGIPLDPNNNYETDDDPTVDVLKETEVNFDDPGIQQVIPGVPGNVDLGEDIEVAVLIYDHNNIIPTDLNWQSDDEIIIDVVPTGGGGDENGETKTKEKSKPKNNNPVKKHQPPSKPKTKGCKQWPGEALCTQGNLGGQGRFADNYDPEADVHTPGSCVFYGCRDKNALNYDPCATDAGPCKYKSGCTDKCASNYDPKAKEKDNEKCKYLEGCYDSAATNYWKKVKEVADNVPQGCGPGVCKDCCKYKDVVGCCDPTAKNTCKKVGNWDKKNPLTGNECSKCNPDLCEYKYGCKKVLSTQEKAAGLEVVNYDSDPNTKPCTKNNKSNHCCKITGCPKSGDPNLRNGTDLINVPDSKRCKYKCCKDKKASNYKEHQNTYGNQCVQHDQNLCKHNSVCKQRELKDKSGNTIAKASNFGKDKYGKTPKEPTSADNALCLFPACKDDGFLPAAASLPPGAPSPFPGTKSMNYVSHKRTVHDPSKCMYEYCCDDKAKNSPYSGQFGADWQAMNPNAWKEINNNATTKKYKCCAPKKCCKYPPGKSAGTSGGGTGGGGALPGGVPTGGS